MPYFDEPGVTYDSPLIHYDDPRTLQQILNPQATAMFDVVLDLADLTIPELVTRLKAIRSGAASETAFASLAADLTALDLLITKLEDSQTAMTAAKTAYAVATDQRDEDKAAALSAAAALATNIGKLATTEAQISSAQMRVKNKPAPKPIPSQPTGLELSMGDHEGELDGHCDGQPGVTDYYEIRYTQGDPTAPATVWQFAATSKKSSFQLTSLPSGQKVWVQMRACNARGQSPWSDPACKRVP